MQGLTVQDFLGVHAQGFQQRQAAGVGPDQDVLAVVQSQTVMHHASGTAAKLGCRFQQAHFETKLCGSH